MVLILKAPRARCARRTCRRGGPGARSAPPPRPRECGKSPSGQLRDRRHLPRRQNGPADCCGFEGGMFARALALHRACARVRARKAAWKTSASVSDVAVGVGTQGVSLARAVRVRRRLAGTSGLAAGGAKGARTDEIGVRDSMSGCAGPFVAQVAGDDHGQFGRGLPSWGGDTRRECTWRMREIRSPFVSAHLAAVLVPAFPQPEHSPLPFPQRTLPGRASTVRAGGRLCGALGWGNGPMFAERQAPSWSVRLCLRQEDRTMRQVNLFRPSASDFMSASSSSSDFHPPAAFSPNVFKSARCGALSPVFVPAPPLPPLSTLARPSLNSRFISHRRL